MASFVDDSEKHHAATFVSILRALIGLIGLVAAAGVTALAARHGYVTGATPFDRAAAALTFSIIAVTGLAGPAVAWRLCLSSRLKPLGVLLAIISAAALVTNVTHLATAVDKLGTIGANILPSALVPASPSAVSAPNNDEAELQRITAGRAALYFNPTSEDAVAAARAAYMEADAAHRADCSERQNPKCEALAADLASKQAAFLAAARDRIATVEAEKLDAEAASLHARSGSEPSSPAAQQSQGATVPQPAAIVGAVFSGDGQPEPNSDSYHGPTRDRFLSDPVGRPRPTESGSSYQPGHRRHTHSRAQARARRRRRPNTIRARLHQPGWRWERKVPRSLLAVPRLVR